MLDGCAFDLERERFCVQISHLVIPGNRAGIARAICISTDNHVPRLVGTSLGDVCVGTFKLALKTRYRKFTRRSSFYH